MSDKPYEVRAVRETDVEGWESTSHCIDEGVLWEGGWNVEYDLAYPENNPCRHAIKDCGELVCPRVVMAYNEGGHASTAVCPDCILEGSVHLPGRPSARCASTYHGDGSRPWMGSRCARIRGHEGLHKNDFYEWGAPEDDER